MSRSVQDPEVQTGLGSASACPGRVSVCRYVSSLNHCPRPQAVILLGTKAQSSKTRLFPSVSQCTSEIHNLELRFLAGIVARLSRAPQ